jgi:hypothetical protein
MIWFCPFMHWNSSMQAKHYNTDLYRKQLEGFKKLKLNHQKEPRISCANTWHYENIFLYCIEWLLYTHIRSKKIKCNNKNHLQHPTMSIQSKTTQSWVSEEISEGLTIMFNAPFFLIENIKNSDFVLNISACLLTGISVHECACCLLFSSSISVHESKAFLLL